ncbi:hypothetical protein AAC387_Pa04g1465 [Persea americana]
MKPRDEIPSLASLIGQNLLTIPPMKHDRGSWPMERAETSSRPSLQYAKRVLKSVLSSWIETLFSGHLEAGFCMIKHVQDILADNKEVGLNVASAKAFVDEVIALGNKWTETKSFPHGEFFNEMFVKPSSEVKSEVDESSRTWKEVIEARQRLEILEGQAAAIMEARDREGTLICQVEEADSNLRRKTQEYERCKVLKKRRLETLEAKAKGLLEELNLWLKTMSD